MNVGYKIIACLSIALGIIHLAFVAEVEKFTQNTLWFIGSGLAIIFAGFLNLALIKILSTNQLLRLLCIIANLTITILFVAALLTVLREPQVLIGIGIFSVLTVFSIFHKHK